MGPPPRSLATDAHNCIMVWIPRGSTEYKVVATMIATTWQARLRSFLGLCRRSSQIGRAHQPNRSHWKEERLRNFALVTFATCNGRDTIVARRALSPSTPRAFRRDPSGSRGLTAKARPSKGVCRAHQCRTALARARSKWKQERVVNFALDNESPIQGLTHE